MSNNSKDKGLSRAEALEAQIKAEDAEDRRNPYTPKTFTTPADWASRGVEPRR